MEICFVDGNGQLAKVDPKNKDAPRVREKAMSALDYGRRKLNDVNESVEPEVVWTKEGTSIRVDRIARKSRTVSLRRVVRWRIWGARIA